jgi:diguanylate cyclase (GGDEF)-like protein
MLPRITTPQLLLSGLLMAGAAFADTVSPMYFEHLGVRDGLSQSSGNVVYQDTQGFIWIGTESGLNRYDGQEIQRYQHRRDDPHGLPSDFVWAIEEDVLGDLWLATDGGGLVRWNRRSDDFTRFPILRDESVVEDDATFSSGAARDLEVAANGQVWVATRGGGLNRLDPRTGTVAVYRAGDPRAGQLASDQIFALLEDDAGHLWVGTEASGLQRLDPATGRFEHFVHDPADPDSISDDGIRALYQEPDGSLWVGTFEGGLNRVVWADDGSVARFERFTADADDPTSLSHNTVGAILRDDNGRLWVGTVDGLNLLQRQSGRFRVYKADATDPHSLVDDNVRSLFQDRGGMLWVGTRWGGVSRWNPRSWSMGLFTNDLLRHATVSSLAARGDGKVWIGALGSGLALLDTTTGEFRSGSADEPLVPGLTDTRVTVLEMDSAGGLWIGTRRGGLHHYDPQSGRTEVYRADAGDADSIGSDAVMSLLEARDGRIWVGSYGVGVSVLDRMTGEFDTYRHDPDQSNSFSNIRPTTIAQTPDGAVWVGTDGGGLNVFDPAIDGFHHFRSRPDDSFSLPSNVIYTLHVDDAGVLWIGTARGDLVRVIGSGLEPENVRFETVQEVSLQLNAIYGLQSDSTGALWISTSSGLWRYRPDTAELKSFGRNHGAQGEEYNSGAHERGPNGMLYFGGANGINAFYPESIRVSREKPPVVVSQVRVMNSPLETEVPHPLLRSLALGHRDDMLMVEFAALDFVDPANNRYAYRLDGFDQQWNEVGSITHATYTNLDAGRYVFRVRAANADGVWNKEGARLEIRVDPAPWETIWAYLVYAMLALTLVFGLLRWQKLKHEREAEMRRLENFHPVSGLPNRKLFGVRLRQAVEEAEACEEGVALLHIDLDKFRDINDTFGQAGGDKVLKLIAGRIAHEVSRTSDGLGRREVAHIAADEFAVFLRHEAAAAEAESLAKRICGSIRVPVPSEVQEFVVTASIGIALYREQARDREELVRLADAATLHVKQDGGDKFAIFSGHMKTRTSERFELENDLRNALKHDQLELYYQPKFKAMSFELAGAEALLRWRHPTHGFVSPAEFIPIAEESGLIADVGDFVGKAVCRQLHEWQRKGLKNVPVAINLSAAEFHRANPVESLCRATEKYGIAPSLLQIEITESMLFRNIGEARRSLARLQELGFHLSLDDFGTGYSSLGYLQDLPLNSLKIDRKFVSGPNASTESPSLCDAIIGFGHKLGLQVVAEGIESQVQVRDLQRSGCDQLQGFLLAKPQTALEFERWLLDGKHPLANEHAFGLAS